MKCLSLKKYDRAEMAFRKALETDKSFAPPLLNLGMLYNFREEYGEAEKFLVQFIEREGHRWPGFFELGDAHYGLKEFAKAENDYQRAMELNPHAPPEIHVKLANVYVAKQEFSKALKELETFLEQEPNGPMAPRGREVIQRRKTDGVAGNAP